MRTLNDYFLTAEIEDISTASSTFVAVPDGGKIVKIITALQGAISGGNAAISFGKQGCLCCAAGAGRRLGRTHGANHLFKECRTCVKLCNLDELVRLMRLCDAAGPANNSRIAA